MRDLNNIIRYLFWQQISYDGSFQLTRKNKAVDKHDTCLTDSFLYWVSQRQYRTHLSTNDSVNYEQKATVSFKLPGGFCFLIGIAGYQSL
jgi:hypothetical protein